ncbi:hypothetical protein PENTCL1PPCAC_20419, partial [Pristionchus entomophagus]
SIGFDVHGDIRVPESDLRMVSAVSEQLNSHGEIARLLVSRETPEITREAFLDHILHQESDHLAVREGSGGSGRSTARGDRRSDGN